MYALWLIPEVTVYNELSILIRDLAKKFNGPGFEPHITLLGKISGEEAYLKKCTQKLAATLFNIQVSSKKVTYTDNYYRSLFLDIDKPLELDQAYQESLRVFDMKPEQGFMPHLSLLYGRQSLEEKQKILREVIPCVDYHFKLNKIQLISAPADVDTWEDILTIDF